MPDGNPQTELVAAPRYRSLVTFVDEDPRSRKVLDAAIEIARSQDAHLTVLALRYEPEIPPYVYAQGAGAELMRAIAAAREEADARAKEAQEAVIAAGIRGEAIPYVMTFRDADRNAANAARFADLAILRPPYYEGATSVASDILDGMLYECDAPALLLPEAAATLDARKILIGWAGSRQALKAVRGALPFLRAAETVEICVFEPSGESPGAALATMLARHDVKVEIASLPRPSRPVAEALSRRSLEIGAGLLVMGAYGHSRFPESIIGGVTRDTLENVTVPLLIAH